MSHEIRKATKKDINKMAQLMIKEFSKPPYNDKWTKKNSEKSINSDLTIGIGYIIKEKNNIIGFMLIRKDILDKIYLFIENLIVDGDYQGKGVGKMLIKFIEKKYSKNNKVIISLTTNKKSSAYNFYKKLGFRENKENINMSKEIK